MSKFQIYFVLQDTAPIINIYCIQHKETPASDGTMTSVAASPEGTEPEIDHSSGQIKDHNKLKTLATILKMEQDQI